MARPPKKENERNSLRLLRGLLAKEGGGPITQNELSEIIDVPVNTIRPVEAGLRPLTDGILSKVYLGTSARWDKQKKRWVRARILPMHVSSAWIWDEVFPDSKKDEEKPFTYALFKEFLLIRSIPGGSGEVDKIRGKLDLLFMLIPDDDWWDLYLRLEDFLAKCWQDFELQKYSELPEAKGVLYRLFKNAPPPGDNRTDEEARRAYQQKVKQMKQRKRRKRPATLLCGLRRVFGVSAIPYDRSLAKFGAF
jgi:hypothetical protein